MAKTLMAEILDLWERTGALFAQATDDDLEILIVGLTAEQLQACLSYLFVEGRQMTPVYRLVSTGETITFSTLTPEALITVLTEPPFEISAMFTVNLPALPAIAYYVDDEGCFSVACAPGREWNAMTLLALFDLLHRIHGIAPQAEIAPDPYIFSDEEQHTFTEALKDYLDASN